MAKIVIIAGPSATGKSTSYCNIDNPYLKITGLDSEKTFMFNIASKEIPVKGGDKLYRELTIENGKPTGNMYSGSNYDAIKELVLKINKSSSKKAIIVEDAQYLMSFDFFNRRIEQGYDKYAYIGFSFLDLMLHLRELRNDIIVYILIHTDTVGEGINEKIILKTIGKMIIEKFTAEGLFSIVLRSEKYEYAKEVKYRFIVRPISPGDIAKSPYGMFEDENQMPLQYINNDLGVVDKTVRDFFGI